jgi:hypothetical protein
VAVGVRSQVRSYGNCGGQSGTAADFRRVLRFTLPVLISPNAPYTLSRVGTIGQLVADVPSLTSPLEIIIIIIIIIIKNFEHRNGRHKAVRSSSYSLIVESGCRIHMCQSRCKDEV